MLKLKTGTLEGLSEAEKAHYKKVGEEFVLDLDVQIKTEEDIRRLSTALDKERADHKDVKARLSAYKHAPEEIEKVLNEVEELRIRANKIDDKSIADLVSIRVKPFEKEKETLSQKLNETIKEREIAQSQLRDMKLDLEVRSVADGLVEPLSVQDAILRAKTMLSYNDEKGGFYDKDGFDVKGWLEKTIPTTNWGVKGTGGGAQGKNFSTKNSIAIGDKVFDAKNNPFTEEKFNLTEQSQIAKANPALAEELQKIANQK